ncbi:MAG: hypothetical protein ACYS21_12505 [Planctomycetota bacterium]|jgi:hypothetical protein
MKQLVVFVGCVVFLLASTGCRSNDRGIEVIVEGGGKFPQSLVGIWRADKEGWEFVFEPDGTISSAVISLGRVRMRPGQITTVPMKLGGKGVFEPGEWFVHYAPAHRELTVKIALENVRIGLARPVLDGSSEDVFVGRVSEDGKSWHVDWTSFFNYVAHTDEYPDFVMSEDPNYGILKTLNFEKVAGK